MLGSPQSSAGTSKGCLVYARLMCGGSGREAARQILQAAKVQLLDIRGVGDLRVEHSAALAFKTSRYETRYRSGGQERVARGTHLWILRREGVAWRVALVTWQAEE